MASVIQENVDNHPRALDSERPGKVILIVEDQADIRQLIKMSLAFTKHTIYEAPDCQTAFNMVNTLKPDLMLLDIMLPSGTDDKAEADSIANAENLKLALIRQNTADSLEREKASAIFWTDKKHGYFTDVRDSQKYDVIKIGGQTWMAQNFNLATPNGSWCYENNQSNCGTYGRLYNWETARKSAPLGWHLPTTGEQETLIQGLYEVHKDGLYQELLPGGSIGFDAPLAGQRTETGEFGGINNATFFWSSSPSANYATWAYYIEITSYNKEVSYTSGERKCGYSVRYVKN